MYSFINKKFDSSDIYTTLSDNNTNKIALENLKQYLLNINEQIYIFNHLLNINKNREKDFYDFDDINSIDLQEINILTPIGQNINNKLPHLYTTNHFQVKNYSNTMRSIINNSLNTNNKNLLFEYNIVNNTLFLCLFKDVLEYSNSINLEENITIKLYFPLIANNDINTYESFVLFKNSLQEKTNKYIKLDLFNNKNEFINTLHYINNDIKNFPKFKNTISGINNINFNIHTNINFTLSLESLFKIINSTSTMPFIKYNPGKKHENIYRLYCNKKNNENIKIPYLSKDLIIRLSKYLGKPNTISMVIINNDDEFMKKNIKSFIFELDMYGTINIKIEFLNYLDIYNIDSIINKNINPIITIIKKNINSNTIPYFSSLLEKY